MLCVCMCVHVCARCALHANISYYGMFYRNFIWNLFCFRGDKPTNRRGYCSSHDLTNEFVCLLVFLFNKIIKGGKSLKKKDSSATFGQRQDILSVFVCESVKRVYTGRSLVERWITCGEDFSKIRQTTSWWENGVREQTQQENERNTEQSWTRKKNKGVFENKIYCFECLSNKTWPCQVFATLFCYFPPLPSSFYLSFYAATMSLGYEKEEKEGREGEKKRVKGIHQCLVKSLAGS